MRDITNTYLASWCDSSEERAERAPASGASGLNKIVSAANLILKGSGDLSGPGPKLPSGLSIRVKVGGKNLPLNITTDPKHLNLA